MSSVVALTAVPLEPSVICGTGSAACKMIWLFPFGWKLLLARDEVIGGSDVLMTDTMGSWLFFSGDRMTDDDGEECGEGDGVSEGYTHDDSGTPGVVVEEEES